MGGLIVIFVLVIFLGNWRAGLVVASVIPLSMLFAFGMMKTFGIDGNLMSLGAIDFGMIVDSAVIIVEAVVTHINQKTQKTSLTQAEMDEEVHFSASRIRQSAAFGEIMIMIVYVPLMTLVGIEGKMFRPMALTVFLPYSVPSYCHLRMFRWQVASSLARKSARKRLSPTRWSRKYSNGIFLSSTGY